MSSNKSSYIASQAEFEQDLRQKAVTRSEFLNYIRSLDDSVFPPVEMAQVIGSHSTLHFRNAMMEIFSEFINRFKVARNATVLDIGCGCGRLAIPFVRWLNDGKYIGFDVWDEGVQWCRNNIASNFPNARFEVVKAENNYYFDTFKDSKKNEFNLDFIADNSLDFVYAISVFTHLIGEDCEQYLNHIARGLKPDGIAYITGFVVDRWFENFRTATGKHTGLKLTGDRQYTGYQGQDFFGGYDMSRWQEMIDKAGLEVISFETGLWADKPGASHYQDLFILAPKVNKAT